MIDWLVTPAELDEALAFVGASRGDVPIKCVICSTVLTDSAGAPIAVDSLDSVDRLLDGLVEFCGWVFLGGHILCGQHWAEDPAGYANVFTDSGALVDADHFDPSWLYPLDEEGDPLWPPLDGAAGVGLGHKVRGARESLVVWLYDRRADITGKKVYFGPNHSRSPWRELGAFAWGCNSCEGEVGGYTPTREAAERDAAAHAGTHLWARAYYSEG